MDPDPQKRPTASVITDKLNKWYDSICILSTVQDIEVGTIKQQFIEADKMINELPTVGQKHSDQIYTSKLINTREITENLSKIVIGSESLDCVEIP
ncbi:Rho family GTPase Rho1 [Gigaspora margarita]|uniref:Rho family GTPase Rho1 n=1 Tax=Gigaspora margarita TaxID=4874 RepID=A0A8H4A3S2_GIGMA|nr:Rho family GTPase Rho1 [Gigaspora margarita]